MSRVKTFDATGIAPNGVLFAGDVNSIQDHYADLSNFAQVVDISALRIAESGLQLLRFATSPLEARITAALRADGIVRGLSGVAPGLFTTTQRDAIVAGQRPQGMMVFNTTTGQMEVNKGSDASPIWVAIGSDALPVGTMLPYTGAEGSVPTGFQLADGGAISRSAFAAYNALLSAQTYPFGAGDGTTTFNKPDMRGRNAVARDNMGGSVASRMTGVNVMGASGGVDTVTLALSQIPAHSHTGVTNSTGSHSHGGATISNVATTDVQGDHIHAIPNRSTSNGSTGYASGAFFPGQIMLNGANADITGFSGSHSHNVSNHAHAISADGTHSHTITSEGGGASHTNLQPYLAVNWIVKVL
jgi:microcystin-dependent protein